MAQFGRIMALAAQEKSASYSDFLEKPADLGRESATAAVFRPFSGRFAQSGSVGVLGSGKAGAGNKPGSVEDNHSSATAVTGSL